MAWVTRGIGKWLWWRRTLRLRPGYCGVCGRYAELRSYSATEFALLIFLPLWPMGRRRVLDECPACGARRLMSRRKWRRSSRADLKTALDALSAEPASEEKAVAAITAAVAADRRGQFLKLARSLREKMAGSAALAAAVAQGCYAFGYKSEARAAWRDSLRLRDDPVIRESLAVMLISDQRPREAHELLLPIIQQRSGKLSLLYLLAESYLKLGQFREAQNVLAGMAQAFPGIEWQPAYRRLMDLCGWGYSTGRPAVLGGLPPLLPGWPRIGTFSTALRLMPFAAVLLTIACYIAAVVYEGRSRQIYIVNGLNRPYEVEVSGQRMRVEPMSQRKAWVAEGDVTVKVLDQDLSLPQRVCHIETPALGRPFLKRTFVINPDGAAVLLWQEVEYTLTASRRPSVNPSKYHMGEGLYTFDWIDFPFERFPDEQQLPNSSSSVKRTGLSQVPEVKSWDMILLLWDKKGRAGAAEYIRNYLGCCPDDQACLEWLPLAMDDDEAIAFLKPGLEKRPVRIAWHLLYQQAMDRSQPAHDLRSDYAAILAKEPENPALAYLLAEVTAEPAESRRLLQQAARAKTPLAHAWHSLALRSLARGDFQDALDKSTKSIELAPNTWVFVSTYHEALLALGEFDRVLADWRRDRQLWPNDIARARREVYLLACKDNADAADLAVQAFCSEMSSTHTTAELEQIRQDLLATAAYARGDLAEYASASAKLTEEKRRFEAAVTNGHLDEAATILRGQGLGRLDAAWQHLTIHIAAWNLAQKDLADYHLRLAAGCLDSGSRAQRIAGKWLSADGPPESAEAQSLVLPPADKVLLLVALGIKYPQRQREYFDLARQLDYQPLFPHWVTQRALGQGRWPPPRTGGRGARPV